MDEERDLSLLETLDHLLDRGVVIAGEATISIAGIDLVYLGLNVVLANVDTLTRQRDRQVAAMKKELSDGGKDEP
jgi:gas vesicle structural protein